MSGYLTSMESDVLAQLRTKSKNVMYETDPEAWLWDVLGKRWWSLQAEIAQSFVQNKYTLVKSANDVGKTQLAGDLTTWWISVFPPTETIALVSAPVRAQIDAGLFRYLRENKFAAEERGTPLPGEITRFPRWAIHEPYDKDLVLPKRPADQNLVAAFQGIHFDHVAVMLDEAGGLQEDFYTGANAVTNNLHARILGIGNPDDTGTPFFERFTDRERYIDWNLMSIAAADTPNFTGEVIYPEDPELDAKIKGRLIQVDWTEMMKRSAAPGVYRAKVLAEFPDEGENAFFSAAIIAHGQNTFGLMSGVTAYDAEDPDAQITERAIDIPRGAYRYLGVDVAFTGTDKNIVYLNTGGKIEKVDQWDASDGPEGVEDMAIARRVHRLALDHGVEQLRIDRAGTSRGVHSVLKTEPEFQARSYILIGVHGGVASPDPAKWLNARAWHYDSFRKAMSDGVIGINPEDRDLKLDMIAQTYKYTLTKKQLQITPKDELKKKLKHSPDHLDAAIYSMIDFSGFTDGEAAGLQRGEVVTKDPWEDADLMAGFGMPI